MANSKFYIPGTRLQVKYKTISYSLDPKPVYWPVCHDLTKITNRKRTSQIQSYPRLQQLIQLYCYLYITDTLYSGEIVGRIIHIILCDAPQGHKYWCGRPERGGRKLLGGGLCTVHTSLRPPSSACQKSVCLHTYLYL